MSNDRQGLVGETLLISTTFALLTVILCVVNGTFFQEFGPINAPFHGHYTQGYQCF